MGEFDLIARYFLPLSQGKREAQDFQNDGAVLNIPAGKELVVTTDMLVENIHFLASQSAASLARKALRTNLSDLSAMGSEPYCYQMALALPELNEGWLAEFTAALAKDNKRYGVFLSGGDTTRSSHGLVISITAFGLVDAGKSVMRSGAKPGDRILVSGTIGASFCGLQMALNKIQAGSDDCIKAYESPEPPVALAADLSHYVHAALDISDGLLADLGHMAKASHLSAEINLDAIPITSAVKSLLDQGIVTYEDILSGGDDYELVMAVPPQNCENFIKAARKKSVLLQDIGVFCEGDAGVSVLDQNGLVMPLSKQGWQHF